MVLIHKISAKHELIHSPKKTSKTCPVDSMIFEWVAEQRCPNQEHTSSVLTCGRQLCTQQIVAMPQATIWAKAAGHHWRKIGKGSAETSVKNGPQKSRRSTVEFGMYPPKKNIILGLTYLYLLLLTPDKPRKTPCSPGKKLVLFLYLWYGTLIITRQTKENTDCMVHTGTTPTQQ